MRLMGMTVLVGDWGWPRNYTRMPQVGNINEISFVDIVDVSSSFCSVYPD